MPDHVRTGILPGARAEPANVWTTILPAPGASEAGGFSTIYPQATSLPTVVLSSGADAPGVGDPRPESSTDRSQRIGAPSPSIVVEGVDGSPFSASESSGGEHPDLSAQRSLAILTQQTRDLFMRDPNTLARYLRQGEIEEIRTNPWRMRLFFGTAVERRVAELARESDDLRLLQHTRSNAPQDFVGPGNRGYDITGSSESSIRSHYARKEVDAVVTYDSIPDGFGVEWLNRLDEGLDELE
jgi:hypothetical protein